MNDILKETKQKQHRRPITNNHGMRREQRIDRVNKKRGRGRAGCAFRFGIHLMVLGGSAAVGLVNKLVDSFRGGGALVERGWRAACFRGVQGSAAYGLGGGAGGVLSIRRVLVIFTLFSV